ncbi:MAG TPA: AraC family transcriptional regulator [Thermoanaerobaculia bacterium]|nr:AraC family transcriptional regulator [Thermoanaerobaculia bacterium]
MDVEPLFRHAGIVVTRWRGAASLLEHRWPAVAFVQTGACLADLDGGTLHVDSTRVLLTKPHRVTRQFGPEATGSAILVAPEMAPEFNGGLLCAERTPRALLIQQLILRKIEEGAPPSAIADLALALAAEVFRDAAPLCITNRRDDVVMAQALLAANYKKPIRLEAIARAVDLSPCHLCRLFKRMTGMHMHQYLNRLRLLAALERVVEPRPDFAEIAYEYGFSSHSHFAAAFRKELGLTPSQARRLATSSFAELHRILEMHR